MESIDFAALTYLMLVDREAPAKEGIHRGERLESEFKNLCASNQKRFAVKSALYLDSAKIKENYWKTGKTTYLRSLLEQVTKQRNPLGGLHIPDFFVIDGEFVLPRPQNVIEGYEDSAKEKGRLFISILIALIVFIAEKDAQGFETPQIAFFIFARQSTLAKGYLNLLVKKPMKFFNDFLYFDEPEEDWQIDFNDIIDSYSTKLIKTQFGFFISEISDSYTTFNMHGIADKLADLYAKKKKLLLAPIDLELSRLTMVDRPSNVRINFSSQEFCFNGTIKLYQNEKINQNDCRVFYFTDGVYNSETKHEVEANFFHSFEKIWQLFSKSNVFDKIRLDFSQTEIGEGTPDCLLLLLDKLERLYDSLYRRRYGQSLLSNIQIYVPQLYNQSQETRVKYNMLEKYFSEVV